MLIFALHFFSGNSSQKTSLKVILLQEKQLCILKDEIHSYFTSVYTSLTLTMLLIFASLREH